MYLNTSINGSYSALYHYGRDIGIFDRSKTAFIYENAVIEYKNNKVFIQFDVKLLLKIKDVFTKLKYVGFYTYNKDERKADIYSFKIDMLFDFPFIILNDKEIIIIMEKNNGSEEIASHTVYN